MAVAGSLTCVGGWAIAAVVSERPANETTAVFVSQAIFCVVACVLVGTAQENRPFGILDALLFHSLLYYGLSNVVPALLPASRPAELIVLMGGKAPPATGYGYASATVAALCWLVGSVSAVKLVQRYPTRSVQRIEEMTGLPARNTAFVGLVVLLVSAGVGAERYGLSYGTFLSDERIAGMAWSEQLLFHGLQSFMILIPLLAAIVWQKTPRGSRALGCVLTVCGATSIVLIAVWRLRTVAMIAIALPFCLFALRRGRGRHPWKWLVWGLAVVVAVYAGVTAFRVSGIDEALRQAGSAKVDMAMLREAGGLRNEENTVARRAMLDVSYRLAALERVASLIEAQNRGLLEKLYGRVMLAGFVQALPAGIRPDGGAPLRMKTAPLELGIFEEGDWVASMLAEAVLDGGVWGCLVAGFVAGAVLGAIDRSLLTLGHRRFLGGLLIVRMAYLLYPIVIGGSVADMTLMFVKATIGYCLLLVLGGALSARMARSGLGREEIR